MFVGEIRTSPMSAKMSTLLWNAWTSSFGVVNAWLSSTFAAVLNNGYSKFSKRVFTKIAGEILTPISGRFTSSFLLIWGSAGRINVYGPGVWLFKI